jgi:hypothetical protein
VGLSVLSEIYVPEEIRSFDALAAGLAQLGAARGLRSLT